MVADEHEVLCARGQRGDDVRLEHLGRLLDDDNLRLDRLQQSPHLGDRGRRHADDARAREDLALEVGAQPRELVARALVPRAELLELRDVLRVPGKGGVSSQG